MRPADAVVEAVRATGLLGDDVAGAGPVLLMCSAGRDSHCLLDVAVQLRGAGGVRVLHVDHGLRAGAVEDATQMAARCAALGVEMVVRHAGVRGGGGGGGGGVGSAGAGSESGAAGGSAAAGRGGAGGNAAAGGAGSASGAAGRSAAARGAGGGAGSASGAVTSGVAGFGAADRDGEASAVSGNVHAWARAARARLAQEEALRVGAGVVATAHTRSDLVETALARFATQPGRRALLAMRDREGTLVRPLLGISREETASYCRERGITYRDDPTNADARFSRARLRHSVVPVLRALNPRAEEAIVRTLGELAEEGAVLDVLVDAELGPRADAPSGVRNDGSATAAPGGRPVAEAPSITVERLAELPAPLARLVLRELCERSLGAPCARAASRLSDVLALGPAAARAGLAAVDVGGGARVEVRRGVVRCVASAGPAAPDLD